MLCWMTILEARQHEYLVSECKQSQDVLLAEAEKTRKEEDDYPQSMLYYMNKSCLLSTTYLVLTACQHASRPTQIAGLFRRIVDQNNAYPIHIFQT